MVGLVLLAIVLLIVGISLLIGAEHLRTRFSDTSAEASSVQATVDDPNAPKSSMRPYRVAKARGQGRDDKLWGLILVIASLGLLWIIPAYLMNHTSKSHSDPLADHPHPPLDSNTRKEHASSSPAGQAVLGALALVVLLFSFALLGPEKQTKKAKKVAASDKSRTSAQPVDRKP
jgi:Ca2+/H+ antiporter